jgi:hypothetical protein
MCYPLVFPIPATVCMDVRESRPPKPRPLRSCTGRRAIRFLGSVSARLLASIHVPPRRSAFSSLGSATLTLHHGRQPWWSCCCGSDLPGCTICASILIFCTSLVLLVDLLDVLAYPYVIKLTSVALYLLKKAELLCYVILPGSLMTYTTVQNLVIIAIV